jgi:hypothetical protein
MFPFEKEALKDFGDQVTEKTWANIVLELEILAFQRDVQKYSVWTWII